MDWRKAFGAFVVLWVATLVGFHLVEGRITDSEQVQIRGACQRLNIVRANDNSNALVVYRGDQAVVALLRRNAKAARRAHALKEQKAYADSVARSSERLAWIPLTNCAEAHYPSYMVPEPVKFGKRLPPPDALKLDSRNR